MCLFPILYLPEILLPVIHANSYCSHQLRLLVTIPLFPPTSVIHTNSPHCSHQLLLFTIPMFTPTPIVLTNSSSCSHQFLLLFTNQLLLFIAPPPLVHTNSCYYSQLLCSHQLLSFTQTPIVLPNSPVCSHQLLLLTAAPPIVCTSSSYCSHKLQGIF